MATVPMANEASRGYAKPVSEPPSMVCAVCGRVLDLYQAPDGTHSYMHSMQDRRYGEDHPAVPVAHDQIKPEYRCDFCNTDYPTWILPAKSFELPNVPGNVSHGDWAACDTCIELIRKWRWESLARRATEHSAYRTVIPPVLLKAKLLTLYSQLQKNITGEPYPITK